VSAETIAAVSTAPGRAAIAVVRISGPDVVSISGKLGLGDLTARQASLRSVRDPVTDEVLDRALVTWFPGPASYTGEDMLELSSHGGPLVPATLLDAVCAAGARPAEAGEFTRRAYLNGKLDLLQVEATLDLIDARSPRLRNAALFALDGGLSRRVDDLRSGVLQLQAMLAYDIDFPEEDEGPLDRERIRDAGIALKDDIDEMLRLAPEGELLREGALTVIAGRPNAGKSSLFNALLGVSRTIVTDVPGTTRDAVEAVLSVQGYPFRLVDTAGLREPAGEIEGMGIEVARSYLDHADLVLLCVDGMSEEEADPGAFAREGRPCIVVRTKTDISGFLRLDGEVVEVSAHTGEGLDRLREAMLGAVYEGLAEANETPLVTRGRQSRALRDASAALDDFLQAWSGGQPPEIASVHLQEAVLPLEEMLGVVTGEAVLDALFAGFCVGK
jgi:tRNA modification GTPase